MIIQIDEKSQAPAHEKITIHEKSHIQLNVTEKQTRNESTLAAECQQFNVMYIPPVYGKNSQQCYSRRRKVRNQSKIKLKKEENRKINNTIIEDALMADCHKLNVQYIPRVGGENHNQCKFRRKKIRNEIRRIKNTSQPVNTITTSLNVFVDITALQTEQPPSH